MKDQIKNKVPHGTEEWAAKNINVTKGCLHDCHYCYAKGMALRFKRKSHDTWCDEEDNLTSINKKYRKSKKNTNAKHEIMFPTSHDITPFNLEVCVNKIREIVEAGSTILIVTKPNIKCIRRILAEFGQYKNLITFRFSIGSTSSTVLKNWEPHAPSYNHRMKCLKLAFDEGFKTSLSAEPMLDGNASELVAEVRDYITDTIWLGQPNSLVAYTGMNSNKDPKMLKMAGELNATMSSDYLHYLYADFKNDPMIRFKDSFKKVVGLEQPTEMGLDI
jgi:DNA repair photolyase